MARISINRRQLKAFELQFPAGDNTKVVVVYQETGSVRVSFNQPPAMAGSPVLSATVTVRQMFALKQSLPTGEDAEGYLPCVENMLAN